MDAEGVAETARFAAAFGEGAEAISRYVDLLASRGIEWGLLGPREGDRLWSRHVLNSVAASVVLPEAASVVDVGSGAGLPGLPLAILRPDLRVTLLEPLLRRFNFLSLAVDELGLADRVRVVRGRAEEHRERYEVVVSRAVAPLPRLIGWCAPLVQPDGSILALKGGSAGAELQAASEALRGARLVGEVREFTVPVVGDATWAIILRRG